MEGGRIAVCTSDRDEKEGAEGGASRRADQHKQSSGYVKGLGAYKLNLEPP